MPERAFENTSYTGITRLDWSAIWAGVFCFAAVWTVFESLGTAIFAGDAHLQATLPDSGMTMVWAIWGIVFTIVAMFVGGRATSLMARVAGFRDGLWHGMTMFGLVVTSAVVVAALAGGASGINPLSGATHSIFGLFAYMGWPGFAALILGWLAAMGGAVSTRYRSVTQAVEDVRRAA